MRVEERERILRENAPRAETSRERREVAGLAADVESSPLRGRPLPLRLRNFRSDTSYLLALGGPPAWMARLRRIEDLVERHVEELAALHLLPESERSAAVDALSFDEVNALIERHNRWFPVESRLAMDPKSGGYALVGGRDYRLEPLDADWALSRLP